MLIKLSNMEVKTIQIDSDTFLVFKGIEYRQINVEDIVSLEVLDKYVLIVTKDCRKFVIGCSLTTILKKLCIEYIVVTKGFLINKKYLLELTKEVGNKDKYNLVLNDSEHTTREVSSYIAKNILEQL